MIIPVLIAEGATMVVEVKVDYRDDMDERIEAMVVVVEEDISR